MNDGTTAEQRKQARDDEAWRAMREADGRDWSPVVGSDNYEYPAWVYQDFYGGPRHMNQVMRQERERKFRESCGARWPEWQ